MILVNLNPKILIDTFTIHCVRLVLLHHHHHQDQDQDHLPDGLLECISLVFLLLQLEIETLRALLTLPGSFNCCARFFYFKIYF